MLGVQRDRKVFVQAAVDELVGRIEEILGAPEGYTRALEQQQPLQSLYRGLGPSILLVSHGSIQFLAYEHFKQELLRRRERLLGVGVTYDADAWKAHTRTRRERSSAAPDAKDEAEMEVEARVLRAELQQERKEREDANAAREEAEAKAKADAESKAEAAAA